MTPPKRTPFLPEGCDELVIEDGYTHCEACGGDGGGDYPARWNYGADEPDYDWAECGACDGTGQTMTPEKAFEEDRKKLEAMGADAGPREIWSGDLDEEIPF